MSAAAGFVSALFWGLLVLSLLVFLHEGGHYLAARASSMRVTEFFLGLPSRWKLSYRSRTHGTEVGITPLLLGGYTRICGMESVEDELLAPALALVQRQGRANVAAAAAELGCDEERAYGLMATLTDWGSIRPYYDETLGEREGQAEWPAAFQTLARDGAWLTEYDRGHDFSQEGSTSEGEPRPLDRDADAFLDQERSHTYLGKGFLARVFALLAGPFVNILLAFLVVSVTLTLFGVDFVDDAGQIMHYQPDFPAAMGFTLRYGQFVGQTILKLLMPATTLEVLEQSSSVVGISVMASEAAMSGPIDLALLVAAVSMSLGFMNLLPIPPLDGGKILVEIIQLIIRRPVPTKVQTAVSYVGVAIFLLIFVFALRNDIMRYVLG